MSVAGAARRFVPAMDVNAALVLTAVFVAVPVD
jgi:hypothetical protein